jgi:C1A family cysteine protease
MTAATPLVLGQGRELRVPWAGEWAPAHRAVDLTPWCTAPVVEQGQVPLCTAAVVAALASYYARRGKQTSFVPSVLFNYRTARMLAGMPDRVGSRLSYGFAAWDRFGLAPEESWPFEPDLVDRDPPADCFVAARASSGVGCSRLDRPGLAPSRYLALLRACLAAGLPVTVEFPLHMNQFEAFETGVLPLPPAEDSPVGAHVVLIMGYDDGFTVSSDRASRGALLVRNSWGEQWGDDGYGWLPYGFVERGLACQSWVVYPRDWVGAVGTGRAD